MKSYCRPFWVQALHNRIWEIESTVDQFIREIFSILLNYKKTILKLQRNTPTSEFLIVLLCQIYD